ncbi:MAG: hypothetical protein AAF581_00190 [Planctomycetota bacterium]
MPHLVQVQAEFDDWRRFMIVGVTAGSRRDAEKVADDCDLNFLLLANATADCEAYGVRLVWGSTFYLVNPSGRIVASGLTACEERLRAELEPGSR